MEIYTPPTGPQEKTYYTYGPVIDEPLAMEREVSGVSGSSFYYYHADGLGSIVAFTNVANGVAQRYEYDAFGMASQTSSFRNSYLWAAREYESETGLYFNRTRYYDPIEGRFISKDTISFAGGDVNLYGYVQNNPVNQTDPTGLSSAIAIPVPRPKNIPIPGWCSVAALGLTGILGLSGSISGSVPQCDDRGEPLGCRDDDPCKKLEAACVGIAKLVESHVYAKHLHPKPCNDLRLQIQQAQNSGCGSRPGVQYALGVYNVHCARDWSNQYPNNTPNFPPMR